MVVLALSSGHGCVGVLRYLLMVWVLLMVVCVLLMVFGCYLLMLVLVLLMVVWVLLMVVWVVTHGGVGCYSWWCWVLLMAVQMLLSVLVPALTIV